jgi:hypothetical protein
LDAKLFDFAGMFFVLMNHDPISVG